MKLLEVLAKEIDPRNDLNRHTKINSIKSIASYMFISFPKTVVRGAVVGGIDGVVVGAVGAILTNQNVKDYAEASAYLGAFYGVCADMIIFNARYLWHTVGEKNARYIKEIFQQDQSKVNNDKNLLE